MTFALPAESSSFRRALQSGAVDNSEVEVLHTGVGEKACRKNLAEFLQEGQPDCLISSGFAGALSAQIKPGELILAKNFSTVPISRIQAALGRFLVRVDDLYTADTMIATSTERERVHTTTGAAAVDMETEFIARICAERGIPLISLRAISDGPNEPFPAPPDVLFDMARQRTRAFKFASFFLAHPQSVPGLIRFARRIKSAEKNLSAALIEMVRRL